MSKSDQSFLRQFSLLIAGLGMLTLVLIFTAWTIYEHEPKETDPNAAKQLAASLAPNGAVYAGNTGRAAMEAAKGQQCDKRQQIENAIQQAQYEAARARRQYDAVDPDNRLVAGELERRWNERLIQLRDLEIQLENLQNRAKFIVLGAQP